jgi:CTP synthase
MQMAVVEFARNVLKLKKANSEEVDGKAKYKVVHVMPDQKKYLELHQYGGTIRLGAWPCKVKKNSILKKIYGVDEVMERHRHRYEVNNVFRKDLEKAGMIIAGTSPDLKLVEAIELPKSVHPFFVGTQFHPEYKSRPLSPHPIFKSYIEACIKK